MYYCITITSISIIFSSILMHTLFSSTTEIYEDAPLYYNIVIHLHFLGVPKAEVACWWCGMGSLALAMTSVELLESPMTSVWGLSSIVVG